MKLFLTSSPCVEGTGDICVENDFLAKLESCVIKGAKALFITATPDDIGQTEWAAYSMRDNMVRAGLMFAEYMVLDSRTAYKAKEMVDDSDFIILGGGHVPTQNAFFRSIRLRELLWGYDGVVMGISAGAMNCANIVYSQPEEVGESVDPSYKRFMPGLGLTDIQILPHVNKTRHSMLDGQRLFEDVTFKDSYGHAFYALPDGSYVYCDEQRCEIKGEAYIIENGLMRLLE